MNSPETVRNTGCCPAYITTKDGIDPYCIDYVIERGRKGSGIPPTTNMSTWPDDDRELAVLFSQKLDQGEAIESVERAVKFLKNRTRPSKRLPPLLIKYHAISQDPSLHLNVNIAGAPYRNEDDYKNPAAFNENCIIAFGTAMTVAHAVARLNQLVEHIERNGVLVLRWSTFHDFYWLMNRDHEGLTAMEMLEA